MNILPYIYSIFTDSNPWNLKNSFEINGPGVLSRITCKKRIGKTGEPIAERCENCKMCTSICPANTISGNNFKINEPREKRLNTFKCQDYLNIRLEKPITVCGLCIYVCPYGR